MTRSMTAYARAVSEEVEGGFWVCEIHSVNRKALDLHLHLCKELLFLDLDFRKMVRDRVKRGQVSVRIHFKGSSCSSLSLELLKKLRSKWIATAKELTLDPKEITLSFLLDQAGHLGGLEDTLGPRAQESVKQTLKDALDAFVTMKQAEGKALVTDLQKRLDHILSLTAEIERRAETLPEQYREKLLAKLSDLLKEAQSDERIFREVALLGEKADVTEEITRLRSHVGQMSDLFKTSEVSVGRTLDFLTQEMLREINTIASKSHDLEITKLTLEGKAEVEKIREQVQNIE